MENKTFKFKTNINCGGCVSAVTTPLNGLEGVQDWEVDTNNKDKILSVVANEATEQDVIDAVQKAGFKIEPMVAS